MNDCFDHEVNTNEDRSLNRKNSIEQLAEMLHLHVTSVQIYCAVI